MSQDTKDDSPVVDCDVHLQVPTEMVATYLDAPYSDTIRNKSPLITSHWDQRMGGKIERLSAHTPEAVQETLCNEFGVDYPILNTFAKLPVHPQTDLAVNLMYAYNDLLLDQFLDEYDHFTGLATVATQKPDKAAEEIDRLGTEDQIVGIMMLTTGTDRPLGNQKYDMIYRAAEDNDLPIAYHAAAGSCFKYGFPKQDSAFEKFLPVHTLAHFWSQSMTLTSLITNGTPVKFPDLEFVFLESGIGWVPYLMYRLNKEYSIRRSEAPLLERSPEEYVRESCYFGTQPVGEPNEFEHLRQFIKMVGADSIVFASDYPHWDFDSPNTLNNKLQSACPPEEYTQLLSGNAAQVFNLAI
jgi:predicted TIM-barrel fold metal-dependent hydrolase